MHLSQQTEASYRSLASIWCSANRPGTRTAVAGLFLAGDWVDTGLPATIESAVVAGHRAADDILSGRAQHDAPAPAR